MAFSCVLVSENHATSRTQKPFTRPADLHKRTRDSHSKGMSSHRARPSLGSADKGLQRSLGSCRNGGQFQHNFALPPANILICSVAQHMLILWNLWYSLVSRSAMVKGSRQPGNEVNVHLLSKVSRTKRKLPKAWQSCPEP